MQRSPAVLSGTLKGSSCHMVRASMPGQAEQVVAGIVARPAHVWGQGVQSTASRQAEEPGLHRAADRLF